MGEGIITYEVLYDLLRKEKTTEDLQKIDDKLYSKILEYLSQKKEILKKAEAMDVAESERERIKTQIHNTKKPITELFDRREKKIVVLAINRTRTLSNISTDSMLSEEKEFLSRVESVLGDYRKSVLSNIISGQMPGYCSNAPIKQETLSPPQKEEPQETETNITFVKSLPRIVAPDLKEYGPFEVGTTVSLPLEIAKLFITQGLAE